MSTLINVNSTDSPACFWKDHHNPVAPTTAKTILTVEEIQKLLPQRPFALVDRINMCQGSEPLGLKTSRSTNPFWGIFRRPIMPGVLIVEAMAQVGGIVLTQMPEAEGGLFAGIDKVRFRQ